MSKVARFLDKDPTDDLREFLSGYERTLDVQDQITLNHLLDELDMAADWYYGQNELNKGRVRYVDAALRLRFPRFWAGVEAVERIFSKVAESAREQRYAAIERERVRTTEFSIERADPRILDRLRSAHNAAKGKGDQGAFDVWNTVAEILYESTTENVQELERQ